MKERERKQFFVIIVNNGIIEGAPAVDVSIINDRRELNAWLTGAGARAHTDEHACVQGWQLLADGRECLIIEGHLRTTKTVAKVAIV